MTLNIIEDRSKMYQSPYILVRNHNAVLRIVNQANNLTTSRYLLNHMAEIGDAIFLTPLSPHYRGNGEPIYMCNLASSARIEFNESYWKRDFNITGDEYDFHNKQTKVIDLSNFDYDLLSLEELSPLIGQDILESLTSKAVQFSFWSEGLKHKTKDIYFISSNSSWPLTIAGKDLMKEDRNSDIKFIITART